MRRYRFIFIVILFLTLVSGCTKDEAGNGLTMLTLGNKSIGYFTPDSQVSYIRPEGFILQLSSDTITLTILLPELKSGNFSVTNEALPDGKAFINIDFKKSSYSATEGTVSITDTSNNSISGIYSVTSASTGGGNSLKISNGKFTKVQTGILEYGTIEDYEHNQYLTVKIGTQTWMAQNIKSRIYSNGDSVKEVFRYSGNDALANVYGLYYTWNSAMNKSKLEMTQGVCPVGWHLPSNNEWQQLLTNIGDESVAGGKLKSLTTWDPVNSGAANSSGFSALGAGLHNPVIEYPDLSERMGLQSFFWTSTYDTTVGGYSTAWSVALNNSSRGVLKSPYYRTDMGFSVRCLKN